MRPSTSSSWQSCGPTRNGMQSCTSTRDDKFVFYHNKICDILRCSWSRDLVGSVLPDDITEAEVRRLNSTDMKELDLNLWARNALLAWQGGGTGTCADAHKCFGSKKFMTSRSTRSSAVVLRTGLSQSSPRHAPCKGFIRFLVKTVRFGGARLSGLK